ncbi:MULTISPECIES: phosphonate C-P lyase system protein PhnH [Planococcus]|uniref:Phosphonate C-P lyase system protein PhnH n=1 Tax=Planococcus faecalis TaxID=1598147 RepID=A0ABM6IWS4_9BACL|nr:MULTISPECIES: phosphonate C-P lyase system protein PhnH [Planococcus]AQU80785.1 phosphonate C-P lyase system protein PhnH [Planococcus faecalis]MDJ0332003.1 phosphonate C-P lyase system protein PhnH [Planococcus sp. S3-L1]OHX55771.1 phosphonate C-P lyase system protein PhnH [Planococcus faecalis]
MAIDRIHDLQQVYRKIVHSMSRPGTISTIKQQTKNVDVDFGCTDALILSAMALLDAEVTFHVIAKNRTDLIGKISEYTSARFASVQAADFIIVLKEDKEIDILEAMIQCKIGNLIDPHQSATWIIESANLVNEGPLQLTGPGIRTEAHLQTDQSNQFWQTRDSRIKEYPMGIDLIFADKAAQIACIPRSVSAIPMEVK